MTFWEIVAAVFLGSLAANLARAFLLALTAYPAAESYVDEPSWPKRIFKCMQAVL